MRVVTWNCCQGFRTKYPLLMELDFDVAVVPESGPIEPGIDQHRALTSVLRQPLLGGSKHLGVLAQHPWHVEPLDLAAASGMPWVLPVSVTGPLTFTLLAIWTQTEPRPYTAQTHRVVTELLPQLDGPLVIAGDLNAPGNHGSPELAAHLKTVDLLHEAGLVSAFAVARGLTSTEAHADGSDGQPSPASREPTYYHWRRSDQPWHIDHVFVPRTWANDITTTVGTYADWVATGRSDHVPVIVDLALP